MGRPDFGTKCSCTGCNERFYDLNRSPAICPKCGAQQSPPKPVAVRPLRNTFGNASRPPRVPTTVAVAEEIEPEEPLESESDLDASESDDEADDDTEIDRDFDKSGD
jgi:uncharacterized protein (TIGR02300 family)